MQVCRCKIDKTSEIDILICKSVDARWIKHQRLISWYASLILTVTLMDSHFIGIYIHVLTQMTLALVDFKKVKKKNILCFLCQNGSRRLLEAYSTWQSSYHYDGHVPRCLLKMSAQVWHHRYYLVHSPCNSHMKMEVTLSACKAC